MPSLEEVTEASEQYDARRMAAQLGVHLVSQVLEEACAAVNSARRIGRFKGLKGGRLSVSGHADLFETLQGDNDTFNENKENVSHLTTSTPHKDDILKMKPDNSFIGQGDEEIDIVSKEGVTHHDDEEIKQDIEEINTENDARIFSSSIMRAVMDKLVETAFANASKREDIEIEEEKPIDPEYFLKKLAAYRTALDVTTEASVIELEEDGKPKDMEEYCYSFLENAYDGDTRKDIAFYIDEDATSVHDFDQIKVVVQAEIHAEIGERMNATIGELFNEETERAQKLEASRYEDAYLTLNRDYEQSSQCSDEDGHPILQDEKSPMQDVELFTASTEEEEDDDDSSSNREPEEERKELAAISAISGASGSRKSRTSLVSRCRSQGARLLSCLRGWWRRKAPGKRKEPRAPGSIRGVCPMSPHTRRRAASLLDQRRAYSPAPARSVVWKFNTVNEALVNSAKWKEYTFEMNPETCGEQC